MKKDINEWTRKDFESLPLRKWDKDIGEFNNLIILPQRRLHESGYQYMDFVAAKGSVPICRLSGCSDVIHIDGIGGYGYNWTQADKGVPASLPPKGWSIDCLKKSGLLRMFCDGKLRAGCALSSFEIYAIK